MKDWPRTVGIIAAILGAICLLLYLLVFDTLLVPSDGMMKVSGQPALAPGDRILIRRGSTPTTGQLARCTHPQDPTRIVLGRVFGERGEKVEVNGERPLINGKGIAIRHGCKPMTLIHPVTEEEVKLTCGVEDDGAWTYEILTSPEHPEGYTSTVIEEGKAYLLSDNRHLHEDSRDFGLVDVSTCEHVVYRLWGESYSDGSRRFTLLW